MKKLVVLAATLTVLFAGLIPNATHGASSAPEHECDRLAANPADKNKVGKGVDWSDLKTGAMIPACKDAVSRYPEELRFQFQLARGYHKAKMYKTARKWYERSSEYVLSQRALGVFYFNGYGVERSYETAVEWYKLSAEGGSLNAMRRLGRMYQKGQGVFQDYVQAFALYRLAGGAKSRKYREEIEPKMTSAQIAEAKRLAAEWRLKSLPDTQVAIGPPTPPIPTNNAITSVLPSSPANARFPPITEKRVALVIGNSDYAFAPLANPKNDALLMSQTLKGLGFDVITAIDASQKGMKKSIKTFGKKLDAAGKDGVGLFFYAGHGVQVKGANYLIPTDAQIETEGDVDIDAINAQSVLSMMEFSGTRLNFVIMDACRNNPYKRSFRSATRGLAKIEAPTGSLIAYATAPGDVAADGKGANSPYTTALSRMMNTPGLSVERMFREVRNSVRKDTNNKQTPWESSSLTGGDFYFKSGAATSQIPKVDPAPSGGEVNMEAMFWDAIKDSTTAADFEAYLEQYPKGAFVALARVKVKKFGQQQVAVVVPSTPKSDQPAFNSGETFRDCSNCPEMVVIPAGDFRMGDLNGVGKDREKPVHTVNIPNKFAVGKYEVTRDEFAIFVNATGYNASGTCSKYTGSKWESSSSRNWRSPGFSQSDRDPVVCVNWNDAKAYARWLSLESGQVYRLLSETEWEYMARAGSSSKFPFGDSESALCSYGNGADQSTRFSYKNKSCSDGYGEQTAPVGSFQANSFGVYDTMGNVFEWVEDCRHDSYNGAPSGGDAWTSDGDCSKRVLRSGSWFIKPWNLRSASRVWSITGNRLTDLGFRISRDL